MRDKELDRLFDRFRRQGDVQALGEVFDETAPELLRVSASLVCDANEADDLLQQTFLTAIERCERYEGSRRLVPWLLGILVHHAREERRRRARPIEAARVARPEVLRPETHALASEVALELERALAELSSEDRAVLDDYLRADKTPAEIARERGLAPGAARMRIHRGLDRLRRSLPAGLALGAASAQGLASVRAEVLRAGADAARGFAPIAGGTLGVGIAGVLLGKKLLLAGILAVLGGLWFLVERAGRTEGELRTGARAKTFDRPHAMRAPELAPPLETAATAQVAGPSSTGPSRAALVRAAGDPDLAALRGRVLEQDGTPVAGLPVALLEADEEQLFPAFPVLDAEAPVRIVAASTVTDRDGVFLLSGATACAVHNLGLDLGGERATLRVLDAKLVPGEMTELGDVVLSASGTVAGRVVDQEGRGVAGARVRIGPLSGSLLALGLQQIAAGGALAELDGEDELLYVVELPAWLSDLEAKLPLATTTTDAGGRFALARLAVGNLTALVDAPGFARLTSSSFVLGPGGRHELGDLALGPGAVVGGRVVDAAGRPVAGAAVRAGSAAIDGQIAVFGPARATDGEGCFRFEHLAEGGTLLVLARRDAQARWIAGRATNGALTLELPAEDELVVEVVDAAGHPVEAPEFFLRPGEVSGGSRSLLDQPFSPRTARRLASPGRWSLGVLTPGRYAVVARAAGLAQAASTVELGARSPATRLVLPGLRRIEVLVLDAATRAPVAGALVQAEESEGQPPTVVARARTGADGRVGLELPERALPAMWLGVRHPRFAPVGRALGDARSFEVALTAGARLVARLDDRRLARTGCTLQLEYRGPEGRAEVHVPRMFGLLPGGSLELERLPAGAWSWNLRESMSAGEALLFLDSAHAPQSLGYGEFELADGETFELSLPGEEVPTPEVDFESLAVRLQVLTEEGRPSAGADVRLECLDEPSAPDARATSDEHGRADLTLPVPGRYRVVVRQREEGMARRELDVSGGSNEFTLTLSRGVVCSGTVRIEPELDLPEPEAMLVVSRDGERWISSSCTLDLAGGNAPFRFAGFPAGTYSVRLLCGEDMFAQRFELGQAGSSALELRFSADDGKRSSR